MTHTNQKIFFLGCGKMGSIIANNLIDQSGFNPEQVTVLEKSQHNHIKGFNYITQTSDLPQDYKADLVFLAIKPQDADQILKSFAQAHIFHQDTIFISILAGKKLSFFTDIFGDNAKIVRSMPNFPIQDAKGVFLYQASHNIGEAQLNNLQEIFDHFGKAFEIKDEDLFNATTAIFGSGPAYIFYLQEIFSNIAQQSGINKKEADELVQTLFLGSSLMSCNSELSFTALHQSVTSKGGTTQAALEVFKEDDALEKLVTKAIHAATKKSTELS